MPGGATSAVHHKISSLIHHPLSVNGNASGALAAPVWSHASQVEHGEAAKKQALRQKSESVKIHQEERPALCENLVAAAAAAIRAQDTSPAPKAATAMGAGRERPWDSGASFTEELRRKRLRTTEAHETTSFSVPPHYPQSAPAMQAQMPFAQNGREFTEGFNQGFIEGYQALQRHIMMQLTNQAAMVPGMHPGMNPVGAEMMAHRTPQDAMAMPMVRAETAVVPHAMAMMMRQAQVAIQTPGAPIVTQIQERASMLTEHAGLAMTLETKPVVHVTTAARRPYRCQRVTPPSLHPSLPHTSRVPSLPAPHSARLLRFCSKCWIRKKEWRLRSIKLPNGRSLNMNGHNNDQCPEWTEERKDATPQETRAYGAAFKQAQRSSHLHRVALEVFRSAWPNMSLPDLEYYLLN